MALHGCKRVSVAGCFSLKAALLCVASFLLLVAAVPGFAQSVIPVPGTTAPPRATQRVVPRRPSPQDSTQSATLRWTREMLADAELTDVFFIDPEYGWAVGDRGVVRVTRDGGQSWRLIRAPGNCRLESVRFLDRKNGWAVGGWTQPYTHKTTGLVLRSHDGGLSWEAISDVTLPALKEIRMFDGTRGWAVGTPSALYPSGIFQTTNGGRSWTAIPGKSSHTWTTCEFRSTRGGIAAGESGESIIALSTGLRKSRADNFAPRKIHDICMLDAQLGWMVGDGGLALTTVDGGLSWIVPPKPVPKVVREQFDFRAVAACGPQCWIAGTPGSRIWHTPDGGQTWSSAKTGINTPITSLTFIDTKRGWAVGSFGTILATTDGGRSWRRQQTGGTRAAVLGVFADTHNVPLELFARLSGNEGYLGQSLILFRRDMPNSESFTPLTESPESGRIHGAMTSVGACGAETAWRYPISKEGLGFSEKQMAHLVNLAADGRGLDLLQRQVVRSIRQWRPEILVVDSPDFARDKGAAAVARRLTLNAVKMAADPTVMTDQMTTGGLKPWRVKRVYSLCTSKQTGAIPLA